MILKNLIFLGFALSGMAATCPGELDPLLHRGLDHFYNDEHALAIADFDAYKKIDPENPISYWRTFLVEYFNAKEAYHSKTPALTPEEYERIVGIADTAIEKATAEINKGSCVDFNRYIIADTMGLRAALEMKNESKMKALRTILQAIQIAKQSRYQDAGAFLGVVNYEASQYNKVYQFFSGLSGVPHSREKGISMIFGAAAKNHSFFADDIWFIIFSIENDQENRDIYTRTETERVWSSLFKKYPKNHDLLAFQATH